jgi:hypothetical protein
MPTIISGDGTITGLTATGISAVQQLPTTGTITNLTTTTISDGVNSTSSTNCIQGSAKAWVNFVGSSATRNGNYNVSSITRNGTGDYTINFANAMANTNYSIVGTAGALGQGNNPYVVMENSNTSRTTSACRIYIFWITNGQVDPSSVNISVFSS